MTLSTLWGPHPQAGPPYLDRFSQNKFFSPDTRGDTSGFSYGSSGGHFISKKSSEKKQAAMSALTLIAFLFFLNILQSCLKDQTKSDPTATIMMMNVSQRPGAREPELEEDELNAMGKYEEVEIKNGKTTITSRKLLSIEDEDVDGHTAVTREGKFIHQFEGDKRDWTNELSQVSDDELVGQRQKLEQLRQLWRKRTEEEAKVRRKKPSMDEEIDKIKIQKFINSPVMANTKMIPKLSQYWAKRKSSTPAPETKSIEFEEPKKKVADFEEFEALNSDSHELKREEKEMISEVAQSLQLRAEPVGEIKELHDPFEDEEFANTPRYRRSEEILTTPPPEQLYDHEGIQVVTPVQTTQTPPTETTKTYHVYTHPAQIYTSMWRTTSAPIVTTLQSTTEKRRIDNIYFTTVKPEKFYANHRPYYRAPSRYRYSPNRRVAYEAPVVRQEYYPMSVVGQYGGEEDGLNLGGIVQLFWGLLSSFAQPLSRIIPQVSKVNGESQCFDLLACEAQRIGLYMGPTAKALANSFSTVLTWVIPQHDKSALEAAIAAGRTNSCSQQIAACDERSGGKSAMTMVAQMLEMGRGKDVKLLKS